MEILNKINQRISEKSKEIDRWIEEQCEKVIVPLYTSVDLRISKHKITPVDTNVFPAGFNNLCQVFRERTANLFKQYFIRKYPKVKNILIIPELHTRNLYYWENICVLKSILESVGFIVEIGLVSDELIEDQVIFNTVSGEEIKGFKVKMENYKVFTSRFVPDLLLINNDFSAKCPKTLRDILQPVEPPVEIGWHTRKKTVHFEFYNKLAGEIAEILEIDPWIISIETAPEINVDFDNAEDRERVAVSSDSMLDKIRVEYNKRGIQESPFLFVKSNSGTYGMAVISVSSGNDIRTLNAEGRKRMRVTKSGKPVRDVVIQEGIPTSLRFRGNTVGEPVVYLVEANVAGVFLRLNKDKNEFDNLNTKGMEFSCISFEKEVDCENNECEKSFPPAYQLIARIASIAAGYEIEKIIREGGCGEEVS
ncbi:MAG: glutamate--cysteine ligase [Deltaproteobacteria bacterium]|nr:glutamate--cysteine ligase [Deltaproteobacteria bacterium]